MNYDIIWVVVRHNRKLHISTNISIYISDYVFKWFYSVTQIELVWVLQIKNQWKKFHIRFPMIQTVSILGAVQISCDHILSPYRPLPGDHV